VFLDEDRGVLQTWSQGQITPIATGACADYVRMTSFVITFAGGHCYTAQPGPGWMFDLLTQELVGPLPSAEVPAPHGDGALHLDPATGELHLARRTGSELVAQGVTDFASNGAAIAYTQPGQGEGLVRIEAPIEGELPELPEPYWMAMTEHHLLIQLEQGLWVALLSPPS
jgi:hypothetical protein